MTFLQPAILLGLAFAVVPILIHLLNKRRHRTYHWAATMFLVRATQQARGRRKLRHFLILACRVLGVAALIFALSRPLAGGWVSWFGGNRPEAILLLLDRSASMETSPAENTPSKREAAIKRIASAVNEFASGTRIVVIDSAGGDPLELASADALADLPQTSATETGADIPGMFERAIDYIATAKPGKAEIWVASDLQESNWQPNDGRWQTIRSSYRSLGQDPPVRVLGLTGEPAAAHSVQLVNVWRDGQDLLLDLEVRRSGNAPATLPITGSLNGAAAVQEELTLTQPTLSLRKRVNVSEHKEGGWGKIKLGPDLSPADNTTWFAFGAEKPLVTTVVSGDRVGRVLALASAPSPASGRASTLIAPDQAGLINWNDSRLVIWQAALPEGAIADRMKSFIEQGGSVLFFPPGTADAPGSFLGMSWSKPEQAPAEGKFPVLTWETMGGPLANFRDGMPMAMDRLFIIQRRSAIGDAGVVATYDDGTPAVTRQGLGRGQAVYFSTLPDSHWSDLGSYNVLLPLIERLLAASARYSNDAPTLALGDPLPEDAGSATGWERVDAAGDGPAAPGTRAGVYRRGGTLAAVNVPPSEVLPGVIERANLDKMLEGIRVRLFEETVTREQGLAAEVWRAFAIALLLFLFAEAMLSLPAARKPDVEDGLPRVNP